LQSFSFLGLWSQDRRLDPIGQQRADGMNTEQAWQRSVGLTSSGVSVEDSGARVDAALRAKALRGRAAGVA
jgi:hypothetical protein